MYVTIVFMSYFNIWNIWMHQTVNSAVVNNVEWVNVSGYYNWWLYWYTDTDNTDTDNTDGSTGLFVIFVILKKCNSLQNIEPKF